MREKSDQLKLRWKAEKEVIAQISSLKSEIEQLKIDEQRATREGDLNKAAGIRYRKLVALEKQLAAANQKLEGMGRADRMLKEEVDEEDVARVVSRTKPRDARVPVFIEKDEDGFYVVECPLFEGCYSQGETVDAALRNIREVIHLILEEKKNRDILKTYHPKELSLHTITL